MRGAAWQQGNGKDEITTYNQRVQKRDQYSFMNPVLMVFAKKMMQQWDTKLQKYRAC